MVKKSLRLLLPAAIFFLGSLSALADKVTVAPPSGDGICLLGSLDLGTVTCLSGEHVYADKSTNGNPLTVRDTVYTSGVGTHAPSVIVVKLNGATRFVAGFGVDDEAESSEEKAHHGICGYEIRKHVDGDRDGTVVLRGTIDRRDKESVKIDLDVTGWDYLTLEALQGEQPWADHVDWLNAYFEYGGTKPATVMAAAMYPEEGGKVVDIPAAGAEGAEIIPISALEISKIANGQGTVQANKSIDGNPITLNDTIYIKGVGVQTSAKVLVKLNGAVTRFVARLGIDDEVKDEVAGHEIQYGLCDYRVSLKAENGDLFTVAEGSLRCGQSPTPLIDADCNGWKYLILEFPEGAGGKNCDHVDIANAYFEYHEQNSTPPAIVTEEEISAALACADRVYTLPGVRFMQRIKPLNPEATVSVSGLPAGLTWNARRSLVEGIVEAEGEYTYSVTASYDGESTTQEVRLRVASDLQQPVPFMGWLSWNVFEKEIDDAKVRAVADAFERYGLADAGYRYLCLDDLWHADSRDSGTGKPLYSTAKFPNGLADLADYVHGKGLKFGIYSDAADRTCAGAYGSYGCEEVDARQYAEWGFDLLKYDYCFAPSDQATAAARYKVMGDALRDCGRDILYYMCEWGACEPWKWGAETGATCWRCTYDTRDCWNGANGGIGILQSIEGMKDIWPYSGVNRFNDADMMCIGLHGTGMSSNDLCQTGPGMTQTEYRTQFSLWCMWGSPLTLSFDVRSISDDDLSIITNEELIAIDQDRMGQQAEFVGEKDGIQIYAKDLENGDVAIAVLNLNATGREAVVDFSSISALDPQAEYVFRDLWRKEAVGMFSGTFSVDVASHETKVYRVALKENADGIAAVQLAR